jgi:hypothetical protein
MLEWSGEQAPPPADGRLRQLGNGGFNKALMPAQAASRSPVKKHRGTEKNGNRKAMAVQVREKARLIAPADGHVKSCQRSPEIPPGAIT